MILFRSWPSEKHFCAWLNVAPNNRISGGKILSSKPRKNANRAAAALRLAAQGAMQSKTAIGAFIRRIKSRLGAPTAINAGAHKLARLLYRMLMSSSARLTSKPDSKPTKSSSKSASFTTFSAKHASLASTSLPWLPPH